MAIHDAYTNEEVEFLKENYLSMPWADLLEGLNKISLCSRDKTSIICNASSLGVKRCSIKGSPFTPEEDALIEEVYSTSKEHELTKNLKKLRDEQMPYRTVGSIQTRASKLGFVMRKKWTDEDVDFVKENYFTMTAEEMAKVMGRTSNAVYIEIRKLGLEGGATYKYTDEEIQFIKDNYQFLSDEEIGDLLHRAGQSIKEERRKLKLYRRDPEAVTRYRYLDSFLSRNNTDWRKRSIVHCGYKSVLTNGSFNDVHHLYSKNMITKQTLEKLSISADDIDINTCPEETRITILNAFLEEQDKYPLGVCLEHDLHIQFHRIYGFGDNTPEQFYEFAKRFPQNRLQEVCK